MSHDDRAARLQVLRADLQALERRIQVTTAPLSPERDALQLETVLALADELGEEWPGQD
ncbi:hypothetical protein [Vulcanococcus limneticus]|uniref:hypothetical protein n=1 Tax=Vulcanococcus limneticus TaxID=2170428 RepID=UPI00398BDBFF